MSAEYATFVHPHKAFFLEFPAHWEHRVEDQDRTCGFGPRERDNVGLWVSITLAQIDCEQLIPDLPMLFRESMAKSQGENVRPDNTLHHFALKADNTSDGQGGHFWMLAAGDMVLFASSQVPAAERDVWNPLFDRLMSSLRVTRDEEQFLAKVAAQVLEILAEKFPDENYRYDEQGIRGQGNVILLDNLNRQVLADPQRKDEIIEHFISGVAVFPSGNMGYEVWDEIRGLVLPVLKPIAYLRKDTPTEHLHTIEWLADVIICYAIKSEKSFRFITGWDLRRWKIDGDLLHKTALENLVELSWPRRLEGSRQPDGGRIIVVQTNDSFDASRLLHPGLHQLLSPLLGHTFLAGAPNRDTLVTFSSRRNLRKRIGRRIRKDYHDSPYAITPRLFLVTPDGIALAHAEE